MPKANKNVILPHLEWEGLIKPIEIRNISSPEALPGDVVSISLSRDDSYKINGRCKFNPSSRALPDLPDAAPGSPVKTITLQGKDQQGQSVIISNAIIYNYNFATTWGENDFQGQLEISEVTLETGNQNPIAWSTDWYINGQSQHLFLPEGTQRNSIQTYTRTRTNTTIAPSTKSVQEVDSGTRDHCSIETPNFSFLFTHVPDTLAPTWSKPVGLEFRAKQGVLPTEDEREATAEIVSFLLGRHMLKVGSTSYDADAYLVRTTAQDPWGNDVVASCRNAALPPTPIHVQDIKEGRIIGNRFKEQLSVFIPKYLDLRDELGLRDALWRFWVARRVTLGANLPILASALELLMKSWFESKNQRPRASTCPEMNIYLSPDQSVTNSRKS